MQIKVNDEMVCELSDLQKKVICHDIHEDVFDADMKRRIAYIIMHKYERCLERLKGEYFSKFKQENISIPAKDEDFLKLVFSRPDYKCRKKRDMSDLQDLQRKN